jgi:hypothetical protein
MEGQDQLVCPDCGDLPDLDCREVPAEYQRHVQRDLTSRVPARSQYRLTRLNDPSSVTAAWPAETARRQI